MLMRPLQVWANGTSRSMGKRARKARRCRTSAASRTRGRTPKAGYSGRCCGSGCVDRGCAGRSSPRDPWGDPHRRSRPEPPCSAGLSTVVSCRSLHSGEAWRRRKPSPGYSRWSPGRGAGRRGRPPRSRPGSRRARGEGRAPADCSKIFHLARGGSRRARAPGRRAARSCRGGGRRRGRSGSRYRRRWPPRRASGGGSRRRLRERASATGCGAPLARRGAQDAALVPVAVDGVPLDQLLQASACRSARRARSGRQSAGAIRAAKSVRSTTTPALRPRGSRADPLGVDDGDPLSRAPLGEAAGPRPAPPIRPPRPPSRVSLLRREAGGGQRRQKRRPARTRVVLGRPDHRVHLAIAAIASAAGANSSRPRSAGRTAPSPGSLPRGLCRLRRRSPRPGKRSSRGSARDGRSSPAAGDSDITPAPSRQQLDRDSGVCASSCRRR